MTVGDDWVEVAVRVAALPGNGGDPLQRLEPLSERAEIEAL